jgi:hypothetical protein
MNDFGYEASNIAYAWVCDRQVYSSPFGGNTGPTAWIAPGIVSPYLVSFALWGCFTPGSIIFAYGIALVASLVTAYAVFRIGSIVAGPSVGLLAAALFAILPYEAWTFHTRGQLDFNLLVLCFALLLLAMLRTIVDPRRAGITLGVVSSLTALFNPGFLLCTGVGFLLALPDRDAHQRLRLALTLLVTHLVLIGPYVAWQSGRIGTFVPVKSNAPVELFLGNTELARGVLHDEVFLTYHPSQNAAEFLRYQELGERAYVSHARHRFLGTFNLGAYLTNTCRRAIAFFIGSGLGTSDDFTLRAVVKNARWWVFPLSLTGLLALRRGRPARLETATLLFTLAYSVPYLLTAVLDRYRVPMTPTVTVALAILILETWLRARALSGLGSRPTLLGR